MKSEGKHEQHQPVVVSELLPFAFLKGRVLMRRLIVTIPVVILLIAGAAMAQDNTQPSPAPKKPPAPKLTFAEKTKLYLQKLNASIDTTKSSADMVVSNYSDPKGGRTTIVITNDRRKSLIGFYVYNFGNVKKATSREDVYKYLLTTNDAITLGSFFVDSDDDIGYKYLMSNAVPLTPGEFNTVYLTMAAVTRERRDGIRELLGLPVSKEDKSSDVKKAGEDRPPNQ